MLIGVCRIALSLPGVSSLKEKRSIVRSVLERARHRHPVAVAEVGDQDRHERAILGFAVVSNEQPHAASVLAAVVRGIESEGQATVERVRTQFVSLGAFDLLDGDEPDDERGALGSWADFSTESAGSAADFSTESAGSAADFSTESDSDADEEER